MSTQYREIPSAPGYLAGADGSIIGKRGHVLRPALSPNGYLHFRMSRPGYLSVTRSVHAAVCEAFHGLRPDGKEVAHLNGIKTDNRAENLAWKTRTENHADKVWHGTNRQGESHYACRLLDSDVRAIRTSPESAVVLARKYGMSPAYIRHVRAGRARKHVTP